MRASRPCRRATRVVRPSCRGRIIRSASTAATAARTAADVAKTAAETAAAAAALASASSPHAQRRQQLAWLYAALLDRAPDLDGFNYWSYNMSQGMSLIEVAQNMLADTDTQALYPPSLTNTEFLTKLYDVALNRTPDAEGLAFWNNALETRSRGEVAVHLLNALVAYVGTAPLELGSQQFFNDKVASALASVGVEADAAALPRAVGEL